MKITTRVLRIILFLMGLWMAAFFSGTSFSQSINNVCFLEQQDSISREHPFGVGVAIGEGLGFLGAKATYRISTRWWLSMGGGYFSNNSLSLQNLIIQGTASNRREYSISLTPKYIVIKNFYLTSGVSIKFKKATLSKGEKNIAVSQSPIGIPIAIGIDIGKKDGLTFNAELGLVQYFGEGSDDVNLVIVDGSTTVLSTLPGSSGGWIGMCIFYYF